MNEIERIKARWAEGIYGNATATAAVRDLRKLLVEIERLQKRIPHA